MKKLPAASAATTSVFEAIATTLKPRGALVSAMFGMPSLKAGGKAFAGVFGDDLVFKLTGDSHARALALSGATLFDPSGMGRAMKEWVVVPKAHRKHWATLAVASLEYLEEAATTRPKPKRAGKKPKR